MTADTSAGPSRNKPTGRPVSKYGKKARMRLFKYKTVDYQHRVDAIRQVAEVGMAAFLDKYCVNSSFTQRETTRMKVYGWIKQKDHIHRMVSVAHTAIQKCVRALGTGTTLPAAEKLARWVHDMHV